MPKQNNQKCKLLYLIKLFHEETDEEHPITMQEIIGKLEFLGIPANRKTIYSDIQELNRFGIDIISFRKNGNFYYYQSSRDFQLAEIKLLVDTVQSAKFITNKKSNELIKKLETLTSKYQAKQLNREVFISGRIKTMNESIYYNVDKIHQAMQNNQQITFQYVKWTLKKTMEVKRNGKYYKVSPWALNWDDENYYLVAYDSVEQKIKHFRVDKMLKINPVDEKREGKEAFKNRPMPNYTKTLFGMFSGEETAVTLLAKNESVGIILDRFGKDILIIPHDEDHFKTTVKVALSDQFIGWVIALSSQIQVVEPIELVQDIHKQLKKIIKMYQ